MNRFQSLLKNTELVKRSALMMFLDLIMIQVSMIMALLVRMDFQFSNIDTDFLDNLKVFWWINIVVTIVSFALFRLYTSLWRFAGLTELFYVIGAVLSSTAVATMIRVGFHLNLPRSFPLLYMFILLTLTVLTRFSYRYMRIIYHNRNLARTMAPVPTMIIGGGTSGYLLAREIKSSKHLANRVDCIIDDNPAKVGTFLMGIPVEGNTDKIQECVDKYGIQEIIIAIPSLSRQERKDMLNLCNQTGCKIRMLPAIFQLMSDEVSVSMLRTVNIEDLLGRDPVDLHLEELTDFAKGKTILVTGGGGSIGSEICRQLVLYEPELLIIFDIYENNAYELQNEIRAVHPNANVLTLIGSVRDAVRMDEIFEQYRPELVFHAAAHKHVPLMEESPREAVKNNVLGTYNVADAAHRFGAERMVLISTDKAVRPTNVMGATKRVCELIVQAYAQNSETVFTAVRFGNVLGSNGSVIPLFRRQIDEGGPVTVTHPEIIRYFMTIPEAVSLVIQCGAMAKGKEIFLLDMGEPVKILDLAENMIRLSGFKPYEDIDIVFTGLRPGEKLYEELLIADSGLTETEKEGIFVASQTVVDAEKVREQVLELIRRSVDGTADVKQEIQVLVPEYTVWKEGMQGELLEK